MKKSTLLGVLALCLVAAVLVVGFLRGRGEQETEAEGEAPVATGQRTGELAGLPSVSLGTAEQRASGIQVAPIGEARHVQDVSAVARVVPITELSALRADIASARAAAQAAQAKAAASAEQAQRLQQLRSQAQDVSLTELQAAQATLVADRAAAVSTQAALVAHEQSGALTWGRVLAQAAANDSAVFERLASGREVLLQVTVPNGVRIGALPPAIEVKTATGGATARYLAPAAQSDERLQGASSYYIAPADGLRAGTTVAVALPAGPASTGGLVPASAIVWWQGRGWVYSRHDASHFLRRQLPEGGAVEQGWFVPGGFANGEPVVVQGAQLLFSEELRTQLQGDEE
ncbi:MAG: multidrug transporter [Lysobacter sp.]|nr:multidrug transporter [Lysobacter sp.]